MKPRPRRPGRPPGNTSDATRAAILRAARNCFARMGFGVTTNRDIAAHAGVTAAAIYQYFDSKVTLYVAAAHEAVAEVAAQMHVEATGEGGASATLSAMVLRLLVVHENDPSLGAFLSLLPSELQRHPEIAKRLKPKSDVPAIMGTVVKRAVAAGELAPSDAQRAAEMFIACLMGMSQYAALHGRARPIATAFAELLEGRLFKRSEREDARAARSTRTAHKPAKTPARRQRGPY